MKRAYVSGITSDSFIDGLLVMFSSLQDCSVDSTIEFCCFITDEVTNAGRERIKDFGIKIIKLPLIKVNNGHRWDTTFQKLAILSLTDYEKIVWIDADMMVIENIDDLFNWPHMSAVMSKGKMPKFIDSQERFSFNSGLMVLEPNVMEYEGLKRTIPFIVEQYKANDAPCGDQNVFNAFYDKWPDEPQRHLPNKYNIFWGSIEDYIDSGYFINQHGEENQIAILHYTGPHKPWHRSIWFWIKTYIRSIRYFNHLPSLEVRYAIRKYKYYLRKIHGKM